jgi:uncharacterized protein YbaP (TraB family)
VVRTQIGYRQKDSFKDPDSCGMDIRLTYEAHQTGMHVSNLENIEDTIAGADKGAEEFWKKFDTIPKQEYEEMNQLRITAHRICDEKVIEKVTRFFCITDEVYKLNVLDRNIPMADTIDQKLRQRTNRVFSAPGVAHIGGEGGIAQLLQQKRWLVEKQSD